MGWIGSIHCEKFRCDFMARTCALMAPVQPVLHRVSCSNEISRNTPKHYETHTNMSLGTNGVDWVRSLQKILMRFNGTNLCINGTSSTHFAPIRVVIKHCQMHPNTTRHTKMFMVQLGGSGPFIVKNSDAISWHELVH